MNFAGLSGRHSCKVYAYDESAGFLLEERIFPGTVLRKESSLEKRIWHSRRGAFVRKCL